MSEVTRIINKYAVDDGLISSASPTLNSVGGQYLILQNDGSSDIRIWLRGDMLSIPREAIITGAKIGYERMSASYPLNAYSFELYTITKPFHPLEITWNERLTGVAWSIPGGDLEYLCDFDSFTDSIVADGQELIEYTQKVVRGEITHYGFMIKAIYYTPQRIVYGIAYGHASGDKSDMWIDCMEQGRQRITVQIDATKLTENIIQQHNSSTVKYKQFAFGPNHNYDANSINRGLIEFDLLDIPDKAIIVDMSLKYYVKSYAFESHSFLAQNSYSIIENYNPSNVTWDDKDLGQAWNYAGSTVNRSPVRKQTTIDNNADLTYFNDWTSFKVTVNDYVELLAGDEATKIMNRLRYEGQTHFGILFRARTTEEVIGNTTYMNFWTTADGNPSYYPILSITYDYDPYEDFSPLDNVKLQTSTFITKFDNTSYLYKMNAITGIPNTCILSALKLQTATSMDKNEDTSIINWLHAYDMIRLDTPMLKTLVVNFTTTGVQLQDTSYVNTIIAGTSVRDETSFVKYVKLNVMSSINKEEDTSYLTQLKMFHYDPKPGTKPANNQHLYEVQYRDVNDNLVEISGDIIDLTWTGSTNNDFGQATLKHARPYEELGRLDTDLRVRIFVSNKGELLDYTTDLRFEGIVTVIDRTHDEKDGITVQVVDEGFELGNKLVFKNYYDKTVKEISEDIIDEFNRLGRVKYRNV